MRRCRPWVRRGGSVHGNEELGGSAYGCIDALVRAVGSEA
jgi:hypothetical protein